MNVRLRTGVDRLQVLNKLKDCHRELGNIKSANTTEDIFSRYYQWVNASIWALRHALDSAGLDGLILTRRWLLQGMEGNRQVELPLRRLNTEIEDRLSALDQVISTLDEQIQRWSRPGHLVVADTSCYFKADQLEHWDLGAILGSRHEPVRLLVPMVVVDELDGLKDSKDRHLRWRAAYTLAVLDRVLAGSSQVGQLRPEDMSPLATGGIPRGEVTAEIVMDPPGHTRLPIADDEIVDRAVAVQSMSGRQVTLLTYDTGQDHRGRMAGLATKKLQPEGGIGDEPPPAGQH